MKKNKKKLHKVKKKRYLNKILGTKIIPRLSIFRSNRHIYGQLIDDSSGGTIISFSTLEVPKKGNIFCKIFKNSKSYFIGRSLAIILIKLNIRNIIFDRGKKSYKGRLKILAEGVRKYSLFL